MSPRSVWSVGCVALLLLFLLVPASHSGAVFAQSVIISEILAANASGLMDEDGDRSDWIEIRNSGTQPVELAGWTLTDDRSLPDQWQFPEATLPADGYLVVFASGKDRRLLGPVWDTVVRASDTWRYHVGDSPPSSIWHGINFNDSGWQTGPGGFGFSDGDDATVIGGRGTLGVFIRKEFTVDDPAQVSQALLHVDFDDAFIAYLNGTEIARSHAVGDPPQYSGPGDGHEAGVLEEFNVSGVGDLLQPGRNVLAVRGINKDANSSDMSLIPYLSLKFDAAPAVRRGVADEVQPIGDANLHTNFRLSRDGEYLALADPTGAVFSEFDPFPPQFDDVSYGLSGGTYGFFDEPTPGSPNAQPTEGKVLPPTLSMDHGFFEQSFPLFMFPETPGSTIRYTTDGSVPTATSGIRYTGQILIDETTVIRAAAFKAGAIASEPVTRSYLFLEDVIRQSANGSPPPGWPSQWGSNATDYGMDPDVVNGREAEVMQSLKSIPSFSIVTDRDHLFDSRTGIYANALQYGREWERPTSAELIFPDGRSGFQIDAGIRIRGGWSRNDPNPKHAFRLYFRNEYGAGKLRYPLFGDEGVDEFDNIDLRTSQNYSWSYNGDRRNTMVREVWSRDTQREMGDPYTRSRYYHLYVNGQYWGVFQTQERAEASYGESYLGGNKDDYDVIKSAGLAGGYTMEATDGDTEAWRRLWEGVNEIAATSSESARTALYYRLQGLNPDGTRNPAYEVLLDAENLINYMLVIFYSGNFDAPISGFNGRTNNFFSMRRRGGDRGFVHFAHDNEHTFLPEDDRYRDRTGPFDTGSDFSFSNPQWFHQQLMASQEYRLKFADLAHKHLFNSGAMTTAEALERLNVRAAEVEPAMLAESARWGDSKRSSPLGPIHWRSEVNRLRNTILPPRKDQIEEQLRVARRYIDGNPSRGTTLAALYPSVKAPEFSTHGGEVPASYALQMSGSSGEIYYTLDDSDPRQTGGAVAGGALTYSGPVTLQEPVTVKARARTSAGWSALVEATFHVGSTAPQPARLAITEINYNPAPATAEEMAAGFVDQDFEFIELTNITGEKLNAAGVRFTAGIQYTFDALVLDPGQRVVLAGNEAAFQSRYGTEVPVHGVYQGRLDNGGERLTVVTAGGDVLHAFEYSDGGRWPGRADGLGSSLELIDPTGAYEDAGNWRASIDYGGSPGTPGTADPPGVVINEVLTHTDEPLSDAIELLNTTSAAIDLSGWYLSDSHDVRKFRIPEGTTLQGGGYLVLDEGAFNASGDAAAFSLNGARGESVVLVQADGEQLRFSDYVTFPAALNGESFGRWPNGSGVLYPMASRSFGEANPGPRVGPVVIYEIMYQPPGNNENLEYVEIVNGGGDTEDLSNWTFSEGISFTFPEGTMLGPDESLVVVSFDPAAAPEKYETFRQAFGQFADARVMGGWTGRLDNAGETLVLSRADEPQAEDPSFYPQVIEDRVTYGNADPWPTEAAGQGAALQRINLFDFPEDPANWTAARKAISTEETASVPDRSFDLRPPYPNPANGHARIEVTLDRTQSVQVHLYDLLGRRIMTLHDGPLTADGQHILEVDVRSLASGFYLIRAVGEGREASRGITVVR